MAKRGIHVCNIDYVEKALEAERRIRRGERQYKCKECHLYHWRGESCGLKDGIGVGKAIRLVRVVKDMPQLELAMAVKISPSYLSLIEKGRREPTIKLLRKIAQALFVRPGVLLR